MNKKIIAAYDLGTSSVKATLVSMDQGVLLSINRSYPLYTDNSGKAEQDPEAWWQAFCQVTREMLTGIKKEDIAALCVSGQMMVCLPLEKGKPLQKAAIWADSRAGAQSRRLVEKVGAGEYYRLTGMRPSPNYSLPKWMRFKEEEPSLYERADCFLSAKDYIDFRLTGKSVTDEEDAAFTQAAELESGKWSPLLLSAAGIDLEKLPPILPCGTVLGEVKEDAAEECGLACGTYVVLGTGDGGAATLGSGAFRKGDTYISLGTSSWVCTVTDLAEPDPSMSVSKIRYLGGFRDSGTMQSGGYSFSWLKRVLGLSYDEMNTLALDAGPGAGGVLFLPNLMGERAPFWDPDIRGSFLGLSSATEKDQLCRAVPEGVAMQLDRIRQIILAANPGIRSDRITLVGGGADSLLWRRVIADVTGLNVITTQMSSHAGALGIAVIAAKAVGLAFNYDEVLRFHTGKTVTEPDERANAQYKELKEIFLEARSALTKTDHRLCGWIGRKDDAV